MAESHGINPTNKLAYSSACLPGAVETDAKRVWTNSDTYKRIIATLDCLPQHERTSVLERVIKWHNDHIRPENKIEINQAHVQKSFENQYPKLNNYILQLHSVFESGDTAKFAFVTGQFSLYQNTMKQEKTNDQDKADISFLQSFFKKQGSHLGMMQVFELLLSENSILYEYQVNDLSKLPSRHEVETVPSSTLSPASAGSINYLALYNQIVLELTEDEIKPLPRLLTEGTYSIYGKDQNTEMKLMAILSNHLEKGGTEAQIINAVERGSRNLRAAEAYKSQLAQDASNH